MHDKQKSQINRVEIHENFVVCFVYKTIIGRVLRSVKVITFFFSFFLYNEPCKYTKIQITFLVFTFFLSLFFSTKHYFHLSCSCHLHFYRNAYCLNRRRVFNIFLTKIYLCIVLFCCKESHKIDKKKSKW